MSLNFNLSGYNRFNFLFFFVKSAFYLPNIFASGFAARSFGKTLGQLLLCMEQSHQ